MLQMSPEPVRRLMATPTERTSIRPHAIFASELDEEYTRAQRYDRPLSLALLSVDGLDRIVDAHGPRACDALLTAVGGICRNTLRRHDVVAEHGSHELALLLIETDQEGALVAAERLRAAVSGETVWYAGQPMVVTASLGVVTVPHPLANAAADLLALAGAALYDARRSGTNRVASAV